MAKKTQAELLQEIVDLLTPVANLARYQIGDINARAQEQQAYAAFQQEIAKKAAEDGEKSE